MAREELIDLIKLNFKEGEQVNFLYTDDHSEVVGSSVEFKVHEDEYVKSGFYNIYDRKGNLVDKIDYHHETSAQDAKRARDSIDELKQEMNYGSSTFIATEYFKVARKVLSVE